MHSSRTALSLLLLGVSIPLLTLAGCDGGPRSIYSGGPIITLDSDSRIVEAIGIDGGRIGAVGTLADVMTWAGDRATRIDLAGDSLLPGFIDAHGHFPGAGVYALYADLNSPPIGSVRNIENLVARLEKQARRRSSGEWVIGMGYDDTLLAEGRHPTRDDLDRVSSEHPVVAWHVSGHLVAVNSAGLEALGIGPGTPDPEGGIIQRRRGSREPNGVLEEAATEAVFALLGQPSLREGLQIIREASDRYVAAGVTTAQNGLAEPAIMQALQWASRLGLIPLRLVLWPSRAAQDALLSGEVSFASYDDEWVRVGAVKLVADGSIQGYTGYLSQPYHVPPGDDPEYRGYPRIPRDELSEAVGRYQAAGLQIAVHGNGDAAIDDILDAYESAQRAHPRDDTRHVIIHAQMARDDQLDRMKALGVIPSFFSLHTYYWGDRHRERFMGPERAARISPGRSALDRDLLFTLHADCPVVPMEPLRLVWSAVNRRTSSGLELGPEQRIGVEEALRAVTIDAAKQHFEEQLKGSLEVGKLADLVRLSASPFERPEAIDEIRVVETIIGGEVVYPARDR